MKNRSPIRAYLPCNCVVNKETEETSSVRVTSRRSKQMERPRRHSCKQCGKEYLINVASGKPVFVV